jgi:hypothetical protein
MKEKMSKVLDNHKTILSTKPKEGKVSFAGIISKSAVGSVALLLL